MVLVAGVPRTMLLVTSNYDSDPDGINRSFVLGSLSHIYGGGTFVPAQFSIITAPKISAYSYYTLAPFCA